MTQTGKWIGQAWQLVMRHFWAFVLFTLVFMVALFVVSFITSGLGIIVLFGPVQAGIYALILYLIKTDEFDVNQIGRGFNRFADTLLTYLVLYGFTLALLLIFFLPLILFGILLIPLLEAGNGGRPELLITLLTLGGGWLLLLGLASMILHALYLFPWLLIVDRKLSFWEAMETSRRTVQKSLPGFLGFLLVLGVINLLGLLFCGLGIFVTFPLQLCATVFAYRELWPEEETTKLVDESLPSQS